MEDFINGPCGAILISTAKIPIELLFVNRTSFFACAGSHQNVRVVDCLEPSNIHRILMHLI